MVQISDENPKPFWSMRSGRVTKIHPSSPPLSKDEGLKNIGPSMSIGNLIFGVNSVTVLCLIRYDSLLQNTTDIIIKCDKSLLQNVSGFLLQMRQFYYKMRQLLQNAMFITNCDSAEGLRGNPGFVQIFLNKSFLQRVFVFYISFFKIKFSAATIITMSSSELIF